MPCIYTSQLATPGSSATNGSANTETGTISFKPPITLPASPVGFQAFYVVGKGAGLTAISGIAFRLCTFTTASTSGTGVTPYPKDPGFQAATVGAVTGQTISSTGRKNSVIFGCGAAGPGGYVAPNPDSIQWLYPQPTTAPSMDVVNVSGTVSLNYEWSCEHQEA
jgi:hypothetical protein